MLWVHWCFCWGRCLAYRQLGHTLQTTIPITCGPVSGVPFGSVNQPTNPISEPTHAYGFVQHGRFTDSWQYLATYWRGIWWSAEILRYPIFNHFQLSCNKTDRGGQPMTRGLSAPGVNGGSLLWCVKWIIWRSGKTIGAFHTCCMLSIQIKPNRPGPTSTWEASIKTVVAKPATGVL